MKQGWQTKSLGEVCKIMNGGTPKTGVPDYWGGEHLWITPAEMGKRTSPYADDTERKLTDAGLQNSSARMLPPHSVILSSRAPIGHLVINTKSMATNQGCKGLIPGSQLNEKFLYYYLSSIVDLLNSLGTGATFKELSGGKLKEVTLPVPPLAEQQRIVGLLDEAFSVLAAAQAHAERNHRNARDLFESQLTESFAQVPSSTGAAEGRGSPSDLDHVFVSDVSADGAQEGVTRTGGREATSRHIPGPLSLAVGAPRTAAKDGWKWSSLSQLARLESGHTPSRRIPGYWGGAVPWIGIQDARECHGRTIEVTAQCTNENGIANSSARILPAGTVCLSRTASVGYVVVMGRPMATSQDFVNWVCSPRLNPMFLKYLFLAEGRKGLLRYASGSVHQTIYFPEAKAFHVCHPIAEVQERLVEKLDALSREVHRLEAIYREKSALLCALRNSLLRDAFNGKL
ncbi:MAG: restriction endonuclease subunit S [Gemmatimonadota bacterium]|nr:restriction endonuclease subunit S [Gemmatimonadota bacterium]